MNAISVRDVYKYFGTLCAVKGVTLDVLEGEFFGLLGPNGAGKTSLINMISGLSLSASPKPSSVSPNTEIQYIGKIMASNPAAMPGSK